jgi:hypothetical protein
MTHAGPEQNLLPFTEAITKVRGRGRQDGLTVRFALQRLAQNTLDFSGPGAGIVHSRRAAVAYAEVSQEVRIRIPHPAQGVQLDFVIVHSAVGKF